MPIFLKIDGVRGDSTNPKYPGWFEIDSFDFGVTTPISSATGQATGRATFSPLTVDLHSLQGLAPLLADLATNKAIKNVELVETDAENQPVYDLKLSSASIIDYTSAGGSGGIETGLKFDYKKVSLTDHGVTTDGGPSSETATATVQRFDAGAGSFGSATSSEGSAHLFLTVDGTRFALDNFDFSVTQPVNGTGQASGRAAFSPLTVDLHSLSGLAPLLGDLTSGKAIKLVELTETTGGESPATIYDLKLSGASLVDYANSTDANGLQTHLTFDFRQASLTENGQTTDGGPAPTENTSVKVTRITAATNNSSQASLVTNQSPVSFFLKIDGVTGDSTDAKHAGWFDVDAFNFDVSRPTNGTGQVTGRASFSPLTVDINSLSGLAPLLADLTTNKQIKSVELVEVTSGETPQTVYDLKLTGARLVDYANASSANGVETGLKIDYQNVTLTDHGVTTDGGASTETTSAKAQASGAGTVGFGDVSPLSESPFHFFLKVAGVTGDSTDANHVGWFDVDTFSIGVTQPLSAAGGASAFARFTPLTVDIHSLDGLSSLLADLTGSKQIKSVELVETTSLGDSSATVYDLSLSSALLTGYSNASAADGIDTRLKLDFQKVTLTDHGVTTEGALGPAETTDAKVRAFGTAGSGFGDAPAEPVVDPLRLFLKIDGVAGDSTDAKHAGWFEVDSFDFGATRPTGTTGRATGRAAFSPLTVDFNSLTGLAPLFADLTTSKQIKSVELVATTDGESPQTVYDLKLSNALLAEYNNTSGRDGVETALTIDFQKAALTDHGVTTDGGPSTTAGTDGTTPVVTAASTDNGVVTTDSTSDGGDGGGTITVGNTFHLFLKVDGVTGDSTDAKHTGWFDVDSFNFDAKEQTNANGIPIARAQVAPLTVDISSLRGLAPLLADGTSAKLIKSVELAETDNGLTVYDIKLTNALLAVVQNAGTLNGGVDTSLSFSFQKVTLTDHGITTDGTLGPPESASFSTVRRA